MSATVSRKRVLLCAASYADAQSALTIAEQLARGAGIDLGGMFLEDTGLFETAALPGQRIVTPTGTLMDRPDRQRMQQVMASEARAFRAALSRFAERYSLSWSFEHHSAEHMHGLWQMAQSWDILLIGHRRPQRPVGPVLLVRAGEAGGAADEAGMTEMADRLAASLGTFVENLAPTGDRPADTEALLGRISRTRAALVLTDAAIGPFQTEEELNRLVEAARCPILVAGAPKMRGTDTSPQATPR